MQSRGTENGPLLAVLQLYTFDNRMSKPRTQTTLSSRPNPIGPCQSQSLPPTSETHFLPSLISLISQPLTRLGTKARLAHATAHNTFLSMLGQTPALLAACTGANDVVDTFLVSHLNNGPLKSLRLVSRGGRAVATPAVSSFTLTLDRQPCRDLSKMVQLLDGVCLRSFGVKVQDKVLARFDGTRAVMYEGEQGAAHMVAEVSGPVWCMSGGLQVSCFAHPDAFA